MGGGFAIGGDGTLSDDRVDRLGHGTAVTAAVREKAPGADILVIKVFWRTPQRGSSYVSPAMWPRRTVGCHV